jgi:hypothetical protein
MGKYGAVIGLKNQYVYTVVWRNSVRGLMYMGKYGAVIG